jgi:hypothetical protein
MNEIQVEKEMRNDEGKRGGEQKGKRNRGEMVVHEKNLYMGEWDEVAKGSKGNGLERSRRSRKDHRTIEMEWERRGMSAIEGNPHVIESCNDMVNCSVARRIARL